MLGVLPVGHVHAAVVKHRGGVDFVRPLGSGILDGLAVLVLFVLRRIGVVPPNLAQKIKVLVLVVNRLRLEGVTDTVAAAEEQLALAVDHAVGGRTPLAVKNIRPDAGVILALQLTGLCIQRDEARGKRGGHVGVRPVLPIGGAGVHHAANHDHRAVRCVVREHAQLIHHVVTPDDVTVLRAELGRRLAGVEMHIDGFILVRAVVAVGQAVDIEAEHLAPAADHVHAVADHGRRRQQAEAFPVVHLAGLELGDDQLPEEVAALFVEAQQDAAVALVLRVAHRVVVGTDENLAVGDGRVAVALRAELGYPLDVLGGG